MRTDVRTDNAEEFVVMLFNTLQPKTFEDVVKVTGIMRGTNTWLENGEILWADGKADIKTLIGCVEDVYEMMLQNGVDEESAKEIADSVRIGKMQRGTMRTDLVETMKNSKVPDWYIWSCEKIKYLFSREYIEEYIKNEPRIMEYEEALVDC